MKRIGTKVVALGLLVAGLIVGTVALVSATGNVLLRQRLAATASAPSFAAGRAVLGLRTRRYRGTQGAFAVAAGHLQPRSTYDVIVGGVKVNAMTTNARGTGGVVFSTIPRRNVSLLGFDPRGSTVVLRDAAGTDVLVGSIPDDAPGSQACCLTSTLRDETETECEDMLASDCTAAGGTTPMVTNPDGTQTPVTSCMPDPCDSTVTPPSTTAVACCINETHDEGSETECEDLSESACAMAGGVVVQVPGVTSGEGDPCEPNPCQPASPPASPPSACCVSDGGDADEGETEPAECEQLTADACTAVGGSAPTSGATSCEPNPC